MAAAAAFEVQGRFVRVNGIDGYYLETGSSPPLILLHGGLATANAWNEQAAIFAGHFRVSRRIPALLAVRRAPVVT